MSVVLPALNESATVGSIVTTLRERLLEDVPLVDEIVVIDPGSVDGTAEVAAKAGATVFTEAEILPRFGRIPGKGEALWKSLYVTTGDLIVFVDADLEAFDADLVTGLLGPLITDPAVSYVKASYDRPLADGRAATGAGRVTELVARPLLNAHWPRLAGIAAPLSGEYAGRRTLLERLPFVTGYGVEFGLLVDVLDLVGLDAIAQAEVGPKVHQHQLDDALGRMSAEILRTAWWRLGHASEIDNPTLVQFQRRGHDGRDGGDLGGGLVPVTHRIDVGERPAMVTVPEYLSTRLRAS